MIVGVDTSCKGLFLLPVGDVGDVDPALMSIRFPSLSFLSIASLSCTVSLGNGTWSKWSLSMISDEVVVVGGTTLLLADGWKSSSEGLLLLLLSAKTIGTIVSSSM